MSQYLLDKIDRVSKRTRRLGRRTMAASFAFEAHDGAFDDARVDAIAAWRNTLMGDISENALEESSMTGRTGDLKFKDRILENAEGADKADAVRVEISLASGFMDKDTHDVVGDEQGIKLLDHAIGLETAEGVIDQALVGLQFVNHQFDLPTFVISTH